MRRLIWATAIAAVAHTTTASANAGVTTFDDLTTFQAAAATTSLETFTSGGGGGAYFIDSGVLNSATTDDGLPPGEILPGVTYSTPVGSRYFFNIDTYGGFVGGFLDTVTGPRVLTVAFDHPQGSFGFLTDYLMPKFSVKLFDVHGKFYSHIFTVTDPVATQFFGFGHDQAITKVEIGAVGPLKDGIFGFAIDDFRFNGAPVIGSDTPEPAAWVLMIAGFGLVGTALRRRGAVLA